MPILDFQTYGQLIYSLQERYPSIQRSTLVLATVGSTLAKLVGQVTFEHDIILDVWELVDFEARRIRNYSYEIYQASEKIAWYDPFEHPHIPELASTYPHHKHIPPDIKHHRVPAPGISFEQPNLPILIEEIEREILPPLRTRLKEHRDIIRKPVGRRHVTSPISIEIVHNNRVWPTSTRGQEVLRCTEETKPIPQEY